MKPIIFSTDMVKAILDGRKTQTRRVIRPQPKWTRNITQSVVRPEEWLLSGTMGLIKCPYGKVDDRLWVRETFGIGRASGSVYYKACPNNTMLRQTGTENYEALFDKWQSPLFMKRKHSRITLEITDIKVERLQEISEEDAEAEGMEKTCTGLCSHEFCLSAYDQFESLWNSLAKKDFKWNDNPFVWVISFKREKK